jgi:DNA-binding response OmpR family regulator
MDCAGAAGAGLYRRVPVARAMKVLIVEDEHKVGQFIERALAEQSHSARLIGTCAAARDALAESAYDAIILDLGLPDGDGLDLLREWRSAGFNEPVLILSARDAVADRIRGLNLGADDYLAKPFSLEELLARMRVLLRRQAATKTTLLEHGGVRMDLLSRQVTVAGRPVELTSREYALLELFLQNSGRVLTRTLIAERIWEASYDMETNLIDVYVRRLRQKLGATDDHPLIRTVRGTGYQLT